VPRREREFCGLAVADVAIAVPATDQAELGIRFFILEDPEGNPIQVFENLAQESPSLR
jgi:hypothetical protein